MLLCSSCFAVTFTALVQKVIAFVGNVVNGKATFLVDGFTAHRCSSTYGTWCMCCIQLLKETLHNKEEYRAGLIRNVKLIKYI